MYLCSGEHSKDSKWIHQVGLNSALGVYVCVCVCVCVCTCMCAFVYLHAWMGGGVMIACPYKVCGVK